MEVGKGAVKEREADSKVELKVMEEEVLVKRDREVDLVIMVETEVVLMVMEKENTTSKNLPQ